MKIKCMMNLWAVFLVSAGMAIAQPLPWEEQEAGWEKEARQAARETESAEIRELRAKAEGGDAIAMMDLVGMYIQDPTVLANDAAAMRWLRWAVATGNAEAQWAMGKVYQSGGLGVAVDHQEATRWFQLAADQGEVDAQADLGLHYIEGAGVPRDFSRGYTLLVQAANRGHVLAMTSLGAYFLEGGQGFTQDARQAEYWFQRAIDAGCLQAPVLLGGALFSGDFEGLARDWPRSYRILRPFADRGDPDAQLLVGYLYFVGALGGTENPAEAVRLWHLAAHQGHREAAHELGRAYEYGQGVQADLNTALHWYRQASAAGHEPAAADIRRLTE